MGISRYPRRGHRIAPATLADLLHVLQRRDRAISRSGAIDESVGSMPRVGASVLLSELDESVWGRWDISTVSRLAEEVVAQVTWIIQKMPAAIQNRPLPQVRSGVTLDDLELQQRTYNCLRRAGYDEQLTRLSEATIGELLSIWGFGAKSLVDLLTSLEHAKSNPPAAVRHDPANVTDDSRAVGDALESRAAARRLALRRLKRHLSRLRPLRGKTSIRQDDPRLGPVLRSLDPDAPNLADLVRHLRSVVDGLRNCDVLPSRLTSRQEPPHAGPGVNAASGRESQNLGREAGNAANAEPAAVEAAAGQLSLLRKHLTRCSRLTLEEEFRDIVVASQPRKIRQRGWLVVRARYGLDGRGSHTLEEVAGLIGVTRERVRQICKTELKNLVGRCPFAPALDRALTIVERELPASADQIEDRLRRAGLSRRTFRLDGLKAGARLLGRQTRFEVVTDAGIRVAIGSGQRGVLPLVLRVVRGSIQRWGATTVEDVIAEVAMKTNDTVSPRLVGELLKSQNDFHWLDESSRWFWLGSLPRNRLLNNLRKIMSVAETLHVSELRTGVARHHRTQGFAPPRRVLLELCRQVDPYTVEGPMITVAAGTKLDWRVELGATERTMVEVLLERGPALDRTTLEHACVSGGMKESTFSAYLGASPIIARLGPSIYALRGASVPPGTVEALIPATRRRGTVLVDYGWQRDGAIWLAYALSDRMVRQGSAYVPAPMRRFIAGDYELAGADGSGFGKLTLRQGYLAGLLPFFRRRGGEPGDNLVLVICPTTQGATVHIGDPGILEEFQTPHPSD